MTVRRKTKPKVNIQVVGRSVLYLQPLAKNGHLGKAKPFVATAVRAGQSAPAKAPRRRKPRRK